MDAIGSSGQSLMDEAKTESGDDWLDSLIRGLENDPKPVCESCGQEFRLSSASRRMAMTSIDYGEREPEVEVAFDPDRCHDCQETEMASKLKEAVKARRAGEWRKMSTLGPRLQSAISDYRTTPENRSAYDRACQWSGDPTRNLIIVGPIGSGKTHLAAHLFFKLQELGEAPYWLNVVDLFYGIKRGFNDSDWQRQSAFMMHRAQYCPILILDDLGKTHSNNTSWIEEQLYVIVDRRYRQTLPTVVTTEYTGSALKERVGESVVSRLEDGAVFDTLKVDHLRAV